MKLLITESQLGNIVFKYLDLKGFIQIKQGDRIYFVKSENSEYSKIMYDRGNGWCYIHYKLVDEISSFFSLEESDSMEVIGRWVENTLQMRVTNTSKWIWYPLLLLRIPSNQ